MIAVVKAEATYFCSLDKEKSKKVEEYIKNNSKPWRDISPKEAIEHLMMEDDSFDIYEDSVESDFQAEEVISVEEDEEGW